MYKKEKILHYNVTYMLDLIAMLLSFLIVNFGVVDKARYGYRPLYLEIFIIMVLVYLGYIITSAGNRNFMLRGDLREIISVLKLNISFLAANLTYLFLIKKTAEYPRSQYLALIFVTIFLQSSFRLLWKHMAIDHYKKSKECHKIMVVTMADRAEEVLYNINQEDNWYYKVTGIALLDEDKVGEEIQGVPVVANGENILEVAKLMELDEVFFHVEDENAQDVLVAFAGFREMGVAVHMNIALYSEDTPQKSLNHLGKFLVITYMDREFSQIQLTIKRAMDIAGAIVGLIITGIAFIFVAPAIYIESPGPVIFKQDRVGKNGRIFKIYKFRSMHMDAEEQKKELLSQNEMSGAMFKMSNDPRVTKVGKFIRKTSIDELPQFWNILKGDMSLVGTRPPTVDEIREYSTYHRRRICITPGLTGMWQTSGRSDVMDFEEVVKLDLEYIDNWSVWLDIKLILKTIRSVLFGKGAK